MSEERNVYRKSELGDSDNQTRDEENVSDSGSNSSGSESDGDDGSGSDTSGDSSDKEEELQRSHASSDDGGVEENSSPSKRSSTSTKTISKAVDGSPSAEQRQVTFDDSKTNGFSDENSGSDSNSESSSSESDESGEEQDAGNANVHNVSNTSITSTTTTTTNTTTTSTSNTSNTANDFDGERSGNEAVSNDDSNEEDEEEAKNENRVKRTQTAMSEEEHEQESDDDAGASESEAESGKSSATGEDEEEQESPTESSSSNEDEEDDYQPKRSTRQIKKTPPVQEKSRKTVKKKRKQTWDSDESDDSDGDSDDLTPPRRKTSSSKSRQKQQLQRGGSRKKPVEDSDESEDEAKRSGTRRKAATVSYKEASEDEKTGSEDLLEYDYDETQAEASNAAIEEEDKSETIERVLAKRVGKKGCTGNQTTIYALEETEGQDQNNENTIKLGEGESENTEVQYLIKWKGWSYIHNTWESEDTLRDQKVKGMKKLENFIKKEQDIEYWRRYAGPEDIDYFECQLELQNELLKSYNSVDRIIARNGKEDGTCEYLCKWQSLPYAESTWEDASLVMQKWQQCVERFEERENSKCTPSRQCKVLRHRPKFYRIKEQPDFLEDKSLVLRDYQLDGLNWLLHSWCKENSVILADEMGLGKTIQTICFLYSLFKIQNLYGPFLCVVPLSTMTAWQREFQLWAPDLNVVTYLGDVKSREMIRLYEWQFDGSKRLKFNCILTTYEIVLKDKLFLGTLQWAALLVDEAHRLKNDDSLLYKSLKEFETNHRLLITGTPLQNSLKELWALLHFIMPEKFVNWEDFEVEHGHAADKGYTRLHQQLEPYILRRVKKDVEKSLPAKVEQILRVEMTSMQKQYYKWILTKNFDALRKGKRGSTSTFLNIVIELKKCCNHAALIRPSEFELLGLQQEEALQTLLKGSGKLVLLDKLLCRLRDTGHRVLIFSQMVRMLDILADYLQKRHFPFQRLDGSIKGEMRRQALDHFNADGSQDFCFLLSTRAGGLGINLATADTVIIFDSDWNPQNDLQAQARAHRIGQKNQVNIYRLVTARSVEEQIVERAKQKMVLDHLVIQRMDTTGRTVLDKSGGSSSNSNPFDKDDLSAILKFGAEELFKDEQENDDELVCDIDEILRRAETRNEDPEMPGDDLLSAFKVASIVAFEEEPGTGDATTKGTDSPDNEVEDDTKDWDDIIPENFRKIVEEKERAKEMEDLYLPPRRKTASNNQADTPLKRGKKDQVDSGDSEYDGGSDASGDGDGRPKKRGRPTMKEKISGFTDAELRRFIRSYRKFPAPLLRLEAIACDAELQEKPLAELKRIGELLHDRCVQFLEEHKDDQPPKATGTNGDEAVAKQKRGRATYSIKLGGVSFNAKTLLSCEEELKPLNEIIPSSASERLSWSLDAKTRPANFDIEWSIEEDSKLLCGIYQYGIGSWEQMKLDPSLKLTDKILFNDTRKPQAKHLQSRAEYLLKVIKKNVELKKGSQRRQRKPRKPKDAKSNVAAIGNTSTTVTLDNRPRKLSETHASDTVLQAISTENSKVDHDHDAASTDVDTSTPAKKKRRSGANNANSNAGKTPKGGKKSAGEKTNKPMHFTANNEPRALDVLGDLDPNIFNECKEKMRPVKRALKALDRPDSSLTNQEQVKQTRECLLSIGKQIDACLEAYNDADKKVWRSNLWYFVSKFTEFDAKKLFKLYKNMLKEKTATDNDSKSFTKSSSRSPQKKSKDSKPVSKDQRTPNGLKNNEKEKSSKKKKREKDRELAKSIALAGDRFSAKRETEKSQRVDATSPPNKRKRDASGAGVGTPSTDDTMSFKRMNVEARGRDRNEERKHYRDDYYGSGNSHDSSNGRNDRRGNLNTQSSANNRSDRPRPSQTSACGNNYASGNESRSSQMPFPDNGNERWSGHGRDRYGNTDYKRDRYDSYNSRSSGSSAAGGYHHRGNRDRRPEKRRYPPAMPPHPNNYSGHYPMPPKFFLQNGVLPPGALPPPHVAGMFRGDMRYPHAPGEWQPRDSRMEYSPEYRRGASAGGGDYDRRQQT